MSSEANTEVAGDGKPAPAAELRVSQQNPRGDPEPEAAAAVDRRRGTGGEVTTETGLGTNAEFGGRVADPVFLN